MSSENPVKRGEEGLRLCDQKDCEFPATHTFMWANQGWTCQCIIHTNQMLSLEAHLGYNIANASVRQMTPDEMLPDINDQMAKTRRLANLKWPPIEDEPSE
jgi:hypothetical protein